MNIISELPLNNNILNTVLDIFMLSIMLYWIISILSRSMFRSLFKGLVAISTIYIIALVFRLETILWLYQSLFSSVIIGFIIIFHEEFRSILHVIPSFKAWGRHNIANQIEVNVFRTSISSLVTKKRGALIVFGRETSLQSYITTAPKLNAIPSSELIVSIFAYDTPLHDGALVMINGRVEAASCLLPIAKEYTTELSKYNFGTRHRAALGLASDTDAVILVISEEWNTVSLVYDKHIYYDMDIEKICTKLCELVPWIYADKISLISGKNDQEITVVSHAE